MRVPCNALEQCAPDCQCGPGTTSYNYDPTSADSFIYDPVDVAMDFAEQWGPGSNQGAGMRAQPSQNYLSSRDQGGSGVARTADNEIIHFTTRKPTSSGHRPRAEAGDSVARRGRGCSSSKCGPVCDCRQRRAAMRSAPSSRSHTPSAGGARVADMPTLSIRNPRMSYDLGDVVVQGTFSRGNTPGEAEIIISVSRKNQSAQGGGPAPSNWDRGADFSNAPPPYQNFDATPTPSYQTYEMTPLSYHSFDPQVAPSDADYFYSYDHRPW